MIFGISAPSIEMFYSAFFGFIILGALNSFEVGRRLHWSLGLGLGVLLISGGYHFFFPQFYPIPVNPVSIARSGGEILYSVTLLLFFSILLLSKSKRFFQLCLTSLFFISLVDSVALIVGFLLFKNSDPNFKPTGILFSGTADACFIACMFPVTLNRFMYRIPLSVIMFWAIICAQSNTALAGVGVGIAFFLIETLDFKDWVFITPLLVLTFGFGAYFLLGHHFLETSGRLPIWNAAFHVFDQFANPIFGFGTGTFSSWGQAFQMAYGSGTFAIWTWLHNEPMQIIFENGFLGLITSMLVFWFLMKRTFKKSIVFPIAAVYAFTGLTEMPLRLFITQFLGICLLSEAFKA